MHRWLFPRSPSSMVLYCGYPYTTLGTSFRTINSEEVKICFGSFNPCFPTRVLFFRCMISFPTPQHVSEGRCQLPFRASWVTAQCNMKCKSGISCTSEAMESWFWVSVMLWSLCLLIITSYLDQAIMKNLECWLSLVWVMSLGNVGCGATFISRLRTKAATLSLFRWHGWNLSLSLKHTLLHLLCDHLTHWPPWAHTCNDFR